MTEEVNSPKENPSFLNSIVGKLSIISIALTGIGIIINNMYLLEFDIIDFNLLQPRNIFTGLSFVIYLSLYYIIFQFKLDISDLKKYSYFKIVFHLVVKYFIIISGLFFLLNSQFLESKEYILLSSLSIGIPMMFLFVYMSDAIFTEQERNTWIHRISFPLFKWLFILTTIAIFIYSYNYIPEFNQFAKSQSTFLFLTIGIFLSSKSVQTKVKLVQNDEKEFEPTKSLFTENHFDYDNVVEKFFKYLVASIFITYGMYVYSIYIHPNIPTNFGGAKVYEISLELSNGDKVKGELIFQNENKYYIQNENELLFIKKDDVAKTYQKQE
jgi:NADH:ubiquinone oxidoreductase subunit 6 (subunit J)